MGGGSTANKTSGGPGMGPPESHGSIWQSDFRKLISRWRRRTQAPRQRFPQRPTRQASDRGTAYRQP